ncbi:APG9-domain-containing protein [Meredithblackwellia eburnea MCA 4105]
MLSGSTHHGLGASHALGVGSSAIGNRSLMGLLGGTRFEPMGFDGLRLGAGLGVGDDVLEESGAREEDEDQAHDDDLESRGRRISDAQLAASLPPPPSAIDTYSDGEEEEDDDAPPDFTTKVPLMNNARKRRPVHSDSSSAAGAGGWAATGLRLGGGPVGGILGSQRSAGMGARERALWRWINVEDLDTFLQEVYLYYVGKGVWAIALSRLLNLLTVGWVIFFSTFLLGCIDYSVVWQSHHLSEVVVDHCVSRFSGLTFLLVISFSAFYSWRVVSFGLGVRKLWSMHEFYTELLEVPENDIQTIPWHNIVTRISELRATHPSALSSQHEPNSTTSGPRLDAHDVANRIMREENYLIALINKDVLDLSIPVPEALHRIAPQTAGFGATMLTKTLEWNLSFCLIGFLFGQDGQVRKAFLTDRNKAELTEALKRRFILMGLINAVFAPFILLYLMMYSFFRYFEEYHKNPSSIGSRQFTQLARWKFREFNELPHLFQQRINYVHPVADQYVNQFPKEKTALISRFVAFLAGSFAAVLILFSLIDPDAFLHFEITPGRTVLFYITLFGGILAVARGMVPDENRVVDPEELMREIVEHTHYLPVEWRGKLHSAEVHAEFGKLFQMKVALFVQELLSVIVTPFVLWYTLPQCAGPIVDFFREFTVHVDGLGYVCSFAVFDFKRHGDTRVSQTDPASQRTVCTWLTLLCRQFGAPVQVDDERWKSKEGKMEKSFLNFTTVMVSIVPSSKTW